MTGPTLSYRCHDHRGFVLTAEWAVLIAEGWVEVPAGFVSDMASVPRLLWWIPGLDPMAFGASAAVLHDAVYRGVVGRDPDSIDLTRGRADALFRTLARTDGNGRLRCWVAWAALRAFGWLAWHRLPSIEAARRLAQ